MTLTTSSRFAGSKNQKAPVSEVKGTVVPTPCPNAGTFHVTLTANRPWLRQSTVAPAVHVPVDPSGPVNSDGCPVGQDRLEIVRPHHENDGSMAGTSAPCGPKAEVS